MKELIKKVEIEPIKFLLLILAILVYRQHQLDHRRVEFTVFNSQYLGKESTRSNSEHDFPNFDTEIKVRQDNS